MASLLRPLQFWSVLAAFLLTGATGTAQSPTAEAGALDLSDRDWSDGTVVLRGEWEYVPGELIDAETFDQFPASRVMLEPVPTAWLQGGERRGVAFGVGTYRLRITLPDDPAPIALRSSRIRTAAVIMANGQIVQTLGEIGTSRESSQAVWRTDIIRIPSPACSN